MEPKGLLETQREQEAAQEAEWTGLGSELKALCREGIRRKGTRDSPLFFPHGISLCSL